MAEQIGWPGKFPHRMRNRIRRQGMCESFRSAVAEGLAKKRLELSHDGSVCMLYMVTFTINKNPSFVSIYTMHTNPSWVWRSLQIRMIPGRLGRSFLGGWNHHKPPMIIDLGLFGNIRPSQGELDTLWIQEPNVAQGSFTSNVTIAVTCVFLQMQSCNIVIVQARLVISGYPYNHININIDIRLCKHIYIYAYIVNTYTIYIYMYVCIYIYTMYMYMYIYTMYTWMYIYIYIHTSTCFLSQLMEVITLNMPIHSLSPAPPSTSLQGKRPKCKGCSFASRMVGSYSVFDSGYVCQSTCCLFLGQGVSITNQIELEAVFSSLEFYNLV